MTETFRDRYHIALKKFADQFNYDPLTLRRSEKFNENDFHPMKLSQNGYQMFLAGAKAALDLIKKDRKGIESDLKSLSEEFVTKK